MLEYVGIVKRLMLIVVYIAEACSEPCKTSNMNLFARIIKGYKDEFKTLSNIWDGAFPQVVTGYSGKLRILPNIYDEASVFL